MHAGRRLHEAHERRQRAAEQHAAEQDARALGDQRVLGAHRERRAAPDEVERHREEQARVEDAQVAGRARELGRPAGDLHARVDEPEPVDPVEDARRLLEQERVHDREREPRVDRHRREQAEHDAVVDRVRRLRLADTGEDHRQEAAAHRAQREQRPALRRPRPQLEGDRADHEEQEAEREHAAFRVDHVAEAELAHGDRQASRRRRRGAAP